MPEDRSKSNTASFKAVSVKKFNAKQTKEMEDSMNALLKEGWELIHVVPFPDYAPMVSGADRFQPVTTAFQIMMGKR
jgi:hypothetical protein